jgi:hypothetical protein
MFDLAEAYRMLDTFVGAGATNFDVTIVDIDGQKRGFRAGQTARQLRSSLPQLVSGLQERQQNIIVPLVAHSPSLQRMGVATDEVVNVGTFSEGQRQFLDYHRNSVLLRASR